MCLQAVLGIGGFRYAIGEGHIDAVELVPHVVGGGAHQDLDLVPELVRGSAFALRVQNVVICELGPRFWKRESGKREKPSF